jgi:hypothetical protein
LKSMWFFISTSKLLTQPPLSMWSLPNLPCAKFWDLLKMNVASTCLTNHLNLYMWRCSHKIFIKLNLSLILRP